MNNQQKKNRLLILAIFGMTIIPFLIAWGLKQYPGLVTGKTNSGQLIIPPVPTKLTDFTGFDPFSAENMGELSGHWLIVNVIPNAGCNEICLDALLKTRQLRLMLNKELPRTRRVVIVFKEPVAEAASQWWLKDTLLWRLRRTENKEEDNALFLSLLREENKVDDALIEKLIANENREFALNSELIRVKPSARLAKIIADIRQGSIPDGMLFLMDPLGNLMMQYEPGFNTYKVKDDLMHLLRISQIG
ncbi:MAG: hypothetical protein LUQ56_04620 [Methylococcaceae bacterium]|nr:hypothetical protein [Methylococcaceae bacterium]MDD1637404.1 hypothetical protein [Methylococcaceae bacterium]